jgi:hypothetical protein
MVSTIEVIITDMFEDSEYSEPARAFKKELIQDSIDSCPVECIHWEDRHFFLPIMDYFSFSMNKGGAHESNG